jgi:hypothetical protein
MGLMRTTESFSSPKITESCSLLTKQEAHITKKDETCRDNLS